MYGFTGAQVGKLPCLEISQVSPWDPDGRLGLLPCIEGSDGSGGMAVCHQCETMLCALCIVIRDQSTCPWYFSLTG